MQHPTQEIRFNEISLYSPFAHLVKAEICCEKDLLISRFINFPVIYATNLQNALSQHHGLNFHKHDIQNFELTFNWD